MVKTFTIKDTTRPTVSGASGETFQGIEVRAKDSIFVMVEATLPVRDQDQPQDVNADLCFTVNGVRSTVVLNATGQDVKRLRAVTYNSDTRLTAGRPPAYWSHGPSLWEYPA